MTRRLPGMLAILFVIMTFASPRDPINAQTGHCAEAPLVRLFAGGRARVNTEGSATLRLREGPGTASPQTGTLTANQEIIVDEGPVCRDGLNWWAVTTLDGLSGWAAEGNTIAYFLTPIRADAPTPDRADTTCATMQFPHGDTGDRLRVTYAGQPVAVHERPDHDSPLAGSWWAGNIFTITDGPQCSGGQWWWQVNAPDGKSGWAIAGDSVQFYLALIIPTATPRPTETPTASATPTPSPSRTPTSTPTATSSPTARPTTTPHATLTPTPTLDTLCWTAPQPRLTAGDNAAVSRVVDRLRLRFLPSPQAGEQGLLGPGTTLTVTAGPVCNGSYYWYQVELDRNGTLGWVAEGAAGEYWLDPLAENRTSPADSLCLAWADPAGVHVYSAGVTNDLRLPDGEALQIALSPNGRFLSVIRRAGRTYTLTLYDLATRDPLIETELAFIPDSSGMLWTPDSSVMLVNSTDHVIWQVSLYGEAAPLLNGWQAVGFRTASGLLALAQPDSWGAAIYNTMRAEIVVEHHAEPGSGKGYTQLAWLADGRLAAAFFENQPDSERRVPLTAYLDPARQSSAMFPLEHPISNLVWNPAGPGVAYEWDSQLWLSDTPNDEATPYIALPPDAHLMWSPGGHSLLVQSASDGAAVYNPETGEKAPLEADPSANWEYSWVTDTMLLAAGSTIKLVLPFEQISVPLVAPDTATLSAYTVAANGCLRPDNIE